MDRRRIREGNGDRPTPVDDLTDRLIEKRERFQYFIVTAATAVMVFTFNNFNDPGGILRLGPAWMTIAGWVSSLLSSAAALWQIAVRHERYWRYIQILESGHRHPRDDKEKGWVSWTGKSTTIARWAMAGLFVGGVGLLLWSAAIGML